MLRNHSHSLFGKTMTLEPHKHGLRTLNSTTSIQLSREQNLVGRKGSSSKKRKTIFPQIASSHLDAAEAGPTPQFRSLHSINKKYSPDLLQPSSIKEMLPKAGILGDPISIEYKTTNNTLNDIDNFDGRNDDSDSNAATSTFYRHLKRLKQQNSDFDLHLRDDEEHTYKFTLESPTSKARRLHRLSAFRGQCRAC